MLWWKYRFTIIFFNISGFSVTTTHYADGPSAGLPEDSYKKSSVEVDTDFDTEVLISRTRLHCGVACSQHSRCFLFIFDISTKVCELRIRS